jgi:hypothetical protein
MKYEAYIQIDGKDWGTEVINLNNGDTMSKAFDRLTHRFRVEHADDPLDVEQEFLSTFDERVKLGWRNAERT